jgi:hypothetical protein
MYRPFFSSQQEPGRPVEGAMALNGADASPVAGALPDSPSHLCAYSTVFSISRRFAVWRRQTWETDGLPLPDGGDHGRREVTMQKKNLFLGLGAIVLATSTLFGVVACDDDEDDGGTATDTPAADTTPSDGGETPADGETPMEEEPTATEAA